MPDSDFGIYLYFIFIIPGFITVWSFRYFGEIKKQSDFEYLGLSVFWGMVNFLIYVLTSGSEKSMRLLANIFAAAFILSILGFVLGWLGNFFAREKWFRKVLNWLKRI